MVPPRGRGHRVRDGASTRRWRAWGAHRGRVLLEGSDRGARQSTRSPTRSAPSTRWSGRRLGREGRAGEQPRRRLARGLPRGGAALAAGRAGPPRPRDDVRRRRGRPRRAARGGRAHRHPPRGRGHGRLRRRRVAPQGRLEAHQAGGPPGRAPPRGPLGGAPPRHRQGAAPAASRPRARSTSSATPRSAPACSTRSTAGSPSSPGDDAFKGSVRFLILHHLRASQYDATWTDSAVRRFAKEIGAQPRRPALPLARRHHHQAPGEEAQGPEADQRSRPSASASSPSRTPWCPRCPAGSATR